VQAIKQTRQGQDRFVSITGKKTIPLARDRAKKMPIIYIDADACPVKAEAEQVASRHQCPLVLVSNGGIRPSQNPLVRLVVVAKGPDEADKYIADQVEKNDIVVTNDIPLAAKVLDKDASALRHNGDIFTRQNIGLQLAKRDLMADRRAADPFFIEKNRGGNKSFSKRDRSEFLNKLELLIRKSQHGKEHGER
jgi:uncharacterized protein YaiI (UPF0178 family)